ncbi:MAG: DUF4339 domain-containing protein [Robiginitomaculum sp.]|nr:DUF4339 domain-containing protein [Robiginitomaculum sp.]
MSWFIKVRDVIYGPYSIEKMIQFAAEGRVGSKTMVSDNREHGFGPANDDPELEYILQNKDTATKERRGSSSNQDSQNQRMFILYTRLSDNMSMEFGSHLRQFGEPLEPIPGVWLLRTAIPADRLRNTLSRELNANDSLMIFEINPDQAAWFNIGEVEDRQFREFLNAVTTSH